MEDILEMELSHPRYDVVVIGGGAAGLMAADTAAKNGKKVLVVEKNRILGKKMLITGKGRCNVTNDCTTNEFLKQHGIEPVDWQIE